ncbi:MAG TPA: AraC family transcriptional regulator [Verrucomicrobiae bacterium]|nr:AraC family transcriptional regulator [Verrucomicrobiae bacterium]
MHQKRISEPPIVSDPWAMSTGQRGYLRETYEGPTQLLPELPIFGWLRFHTALPGALKPDRHPDEFEIHYMVRGHLRWRVEQELHEFSTGRVFIIRPNELHGGDEGSIQPCEHYWLRIQFPAKGALPSLTAAETQALRDAYEHLRHPTFAASPEVKDFLERLLEEHRHGRSEQAVLMARSMLHALLITILRDHHRHHQAAKQKPLVTWHVRRTLEWLEGKLFESEMRLDAVASNVGLSRAGLRARFKAETGYTLHEYLIHRRVEEAHRRLSGTDEDITNIAHALGFSSSQYFATVFRRETGMTPGEYRDSHRKG